MKITINQETFTVESVRDLGFSNATLVEIETEEGEDFILATSREDAGKVARERWEDMAYNDPSEFCCLVGDENIILWALGQYAGPGSVQVKSLQDWFDVIADHPEEEFAGYDGEERDIDSISPELADHLIDEFDLSINGEGVAYRTN